MPDDSKPVVVVTGSSGLIGYALCEALSDRYAVMGFDRPGVPHPPPDAVNVPCDLTSDQSVSEAFEHVRRNYGDRIASVVHLAAYYNFSGQPSDLYEKVTIRGTERLLRQLRSFDVGQFIFSSTMLVHAPCVPGQHINEDWPVLPKWAYPESKVATESLILEQHGNTPVALLRIAGVYNDHCHSIPIANQIQRIDERRLTSKVFPGNTLAGQSFIHLDDLIDSMQRVVDRRAQLPLRTVLLIGESEPLSYDELQRTLAWLLHREADWDTRRIPKAIAKTGAWVQDKIPGIEDPFIEPWMIDLADDHYALDISRARKLLDWQPRTTLRETLSKMVDYLRADRSGFFWENNLQEATQPVGAEAHSDGD